MEKTTKKRSKMGRLKRGFLAGALVVAAAVGAYGFHNKINEAAGPIRPRSGSTLEALTEANTKLRAFPTQIGGAGNVQKHEVPGAKYCLVNLKQKHFVLDKKLTLKRIKEEKGGIDRVQKLYRGINDCQKDIHTILTELVDKGHIDGARLEGIRTIDPCDEREYLEGGYFHKLRALNDQHYFSDNILRSLGTMNHLRHYVEQGRASPLSTEEETKVKYEKAKKDFDKVKYIPGGARKLALDGKLKILPAETKEAHDTGNHEIRENALLRLVAAGQDPLSLAVYGSYHNIRDNIDRWNDKNPNRKISLIEIAPENL